MAVAITSLLLINFSLITYHLSGTIKFDEGTVENTFTFGGEKLHTAGEQGKRAYLGGYEFVNGKIENYQSRWLGKGPQAKAGRLAFDDGSPYAARFQYLIKDHPASFGVGALNVSSAVLFEDKNQDGLVAPNADPEDPANEVLPTRQWVKGPADESYYYPFGMGINEKLWATAPAPPATPEHAYTYNGKEVEKSYGLGWSFYGARMYDAEVGRFTGVDPLTEKFTSSNPYAYVLNSPIQLIDPTGMAPEWIPSADSKGRIILTAEEGDDAETLKSFLGGESNARKFVDEVYLSGVVSFSEGDQVRLNATNVFSESMRFYADNLEEFNGREDTYDCQEACAKTVLENIPLKKVKSTFSDMTPAKARDWGETWSKKIEIDKSALQFGTTFSTWNWTSINPLSIHAAVYFGQDNSGEEYFFTKNGLGGPLDIQSFSELNKTYYLPEWTRNNYKKDE